MEIIKYMGGGIKVKKYYTVLDLPEVKIVTLTVNKRPVEITFTEIRENGKQMLTGFLNDESKKRTMLLLEVMEGHMYAGVSYDKYDMTITLLRNDINLFG